MKKTSIPFLLFVVLITISCNDLLDIEAENTFSGDLYNSDQNMADLLNGAYINFGGIFDGADGGELFGGDFQLMGTLLSRQKNTLFFWRASEAPDYQDFMDKDILDINVRVENNWRRAYETIGILNGIINNISSVSNGTERNRIEAEALAMRGILYFEMVRFWGPQYRSSNLNQPAIPIITDHITDINELTTPVRATVEAVYNQAINDLSAANILFQNVPLDLTRINTNVCNAFLARIYMQQNDFGQALSFLDDVINAGYTLSPHPMNAFNNSAQTGEDIFIIQQNQVSNTGNVGSRTGLVPHIASLPSVGFAAINVNYEILSSKTVENSPRFYDADLRFGLQNDLTQVSTAADISTTTGYYNDVINTLTVSPAKFYKGDAFIPVIRLAEIKLSRSEALLRTQGVAAAKQDLDDIRLRAGLTLLPDTLTEFEFFDSLVIERNRELIFEGLFFHDLKRWSADGRRFNNDRDDFSISFMDPLDEELILPIPQSECDASPGLCD